MANGGHPSRPATPRRGHSPPQTSGCTGRTQTAATCRARYARASCWAATATAGEGRPTGHPPKHTPPTQTHGGSPMGRNRAAQTTPQSRHNRDTEADNEREGGVGVRHRYGSRPSLAVPSKSHTAAAAAVRAVARLDHEGPLARAPSWRENSGQPPRTCQCAIAARRGWPSSTADAPASPPAARPTLTARSSPVSGCPAISPHPSSSPSPSQHQNECGGKRPEARGGDSPVTPQPQRRKHGDDGAPRRGRIPPHVICPMDGMKNVLTVCGGDEAPRGERKKGHPMPPEFHRSSQREHRQKRRPCARTRGGG